MAGAAAPLCDWCLACTDRWGSGLNGLSIGLAVGVSSVVTKRISLTIVSLRRRNSSPAGGESRNVNPDGWSIGRV